MRFSPSHILSTAKPDRFDEGVIEKVLHLVHLLNRLPPVSQLNFVQSPAKAIAYPPALVTESSGATSHL